jgi:broad-specificity NMP kinase
MLTLITGVPGAGKTLRAVQKLIEFSEHNEKLRQKNKRGQRVRRG